MAVEALCPMCGAVFSLRDDMNGKKVRCTKCEHAFTVGREAKAKEREEKEAVKSKAGGKKSRDDDDDDMPRPKKKKRTSDDDDDGGKSKKLSSQVQRKGSKRSSSDSGIPGKTFAIAGGALLALVLVCGGGGYLVSRMIWGVEDTAENIAEDLKKNNQPKPPEHKIENVNDALVWLKGNNENDRRAALEWFAHNKADEARQSEVAQSLNPLLSDADGGTRERAVNALKVWATKDSVPALIKALEDDRFTQKGQAMAMLGQLKDPRGAAPVAARLLVGGDRKAAGDALIAMGPIAKDAVDAYANNPDKAVQREVDRILASYGVNTGDLELPRVLTDLASPAGRTRSDAAKRLASMKVDQAQQAKVAKALEAAIENTTDRGAEEQAIRALGVWGTKENTLCLVKIAEAADQSANCKNAAIDLLVKSKDDRVVKPLAMRLKEPRERGNASKQLIALGPELGAAIETEISDNLDGTDRGLKNESAKILGAVGTKASIAKLEQAATKALAAKPQQKDVAQNCNDALAAIKAR